MTIEDPPLVRQEPLEVTGYKYSKSRMVSSSRTLLKMTCNSLILEGLFLDTLYKFLLVSPLILHNG